MEEHITHIVDTESKYDLLSSMLENNPQLVALYPQLATSTSLTKTVFETWKVPSAVVYAVIEELREIRAEDVISLLTAWADEYTKKSKTIPIIGSVEEIFDQGLNLFFLNNKTSILYFEKAAELNYPPAIVLLCKVLESSNDPNIQTFISKCIPHKNWFMEKSLTNNPLYQSLLGCYLEVVEHNFASAIEWERKAAEQGYPIAQLYVGWYYEKGRGVTQNIATALEWYHKAADQHFGWAEVNIARYYADDMKDVTTAYYWYQRAADHGYIPAMHCVGVCYQYGEGVAQSHEKSVQWYWKAAELGDEKAQCSLALAFKLGRGIRKDTRQAIYWYSKAADQNFAKGYYGLSQMYRSGEEYDEAKILYFYEKAASGGYGQAQVNLGYIHYYGKYGLSKDYEKALYWFRRSVENDTAEGYAALAECYLRGRGVDSDISQALQYLQKGAELDNDECQYRLGLCYLNGMRVKKNISLAVHWFKKAAANDLLEAKQRLGTLLENEPSVQNYRLAVSYYQQAAEKNHSEAQFCLGNCYYRGMGVQQNFQKALEWYYKAADNGHAHSIRQIAYCYHFGDGVEQNLEMALEWFKKEYELHHTSMLYREMKPYYSCQKCSKEE